MRVIWPDELEGSQGGIAEHPECADALLCESGLDAEPAILRFPAVWQRGSEERGSEDGDPQGVRPEDQSPADRARLIHRNSFCRCCQRTLVSLILAEDGRRDGTGDFVPGTQTLIGFRCECCRSEWSARL